jgi:Flp pilus assembly protein TadD
VRTAKDPYRLVRVRAAAALAPVPSNMVGEEDQQHVANAIAEFMAATTARPDDWASHYNLGNFYASGRDFESAIRAYEAASKLRPDAVAPYANAAMAYNALGQNDKAEDTLRKAAALAPDSAPVHVNLGMLLGELGRSEEAAAEFQAALDADANSAVAAFNLGVILADTDPDKGIRWCTRAYELQPGNDKYGYTLAFYLRKNGDVERAINVLSELCANSTENSDAYMLLGTIYESQGEIERAIDLYRRAVENEALPEQVRNSLGARLKALLARQSNE